VFLVTFVTFVKIFGSSIIIIIFFLLGRVVGLDQSPMILPVWQCCISFYM